MIKAVVFDYGGTLVKSKTPWAEAKPVALEAVYAFLVGKGLKATLAEFLEVDESLFGEYLEREKKENRDIPDAVRYRELVGRLFPARRRAWRERTADQASDVFWHVVVKNHSLRRGTRSSLSELSSMGLRLAVISNHHNHKALLDHLESLGIDGCFERIFSSSQLGVRKPDPRIFRRCLSALGVEPAQAVFVGDSPDHDVAGAKAVGLHTVLITKGEYPTEGAEADFVVSTLAEVPGIVASLSRARRR